MNPWRIFHEGEVTLRVVERATVRDEPVKLLGNAARWPRASAGRLNCYRFHIKEVSDFNESPVHASLSTALCSFSLHLWRPAGRKKHMTTSENQLSNLTPLDVQWNRIMLPHLDSLFWIGFIWIAERRTNTTHCPFTDENELQKEVQPSLY